MPLKVITRADTGTLWISGTVRPAGAKQGYRVRQRAGSDDEILAREEASALEREIIRNHHLGARPIERGFAAAVISYMQYETRSESTKVLVNRLLRHFGNIALRKIDQETVDGARKAILREDARPGTVLRNVIGPLRAVLMHAHRRGWCDEPKFDVPKVGEGRARFLLPAEFEALYAEAPKRLRPLLRFLVCTGCRMGETLALTWDQVDLRGARVTVWPDQTKADRRRIVTLPPVAVVALAALPHRDGHVFRSRYHDANGELLAYRQTSAGGGGQIHVAFGAAARRAGVPGITPHGLRHTWASWHYALHRDLLLLKRDGDWSSIALVERYAHLVPVGHEDAIRRVWGVGGPVDVGMRA